MRSSIDDLCVALSGIPSNRITAAYAAASFVEHFGLYPPIGYDELARLTEENGFVIRRQRLIYGMRGFNATITRDGRSRTEIRIHDLEPPHVAKMTLAHELAEVILRRLDEVRPGLGSMPRDIVEPWANKFASHVCMPATYFRERMARFGMNPILLADTFDVSIDAVLVRLAKDVQGRAHLSGYECQIRRSDETVISPGERRGTYSAPPIPDEVLRAVILRALTEESDLIGIPSSTADPADSGDPGVLLDVYLDSHSDVPKRAVIIAVAPGLKEALRAPYQSEFVRAGQCTRAVTRFVDGAA